MSGCSEESGGQDFGVPTRLLLDGRIEEAATRRGLLCAKPLVAAIRARAAERAANFVAINRSKTILHGANFPIENGRCEFAVLRPRQVRERQERNPV
jgi:hypothetical protein